MLTLVYRREFGQPYHETKFVLPAQLGPVLAAYLRRVFPDTSPYARSSLTTTYYDDAALSSYWQSKDGLEQKMKFRLRRYFNPLGVGADFGVEIKRRDAGLVDKAKILLAAAGEHLPAPLDFGNLLDRVQAVPGAEAAALRCHVRTTLRPTLSISCERLRFVNQRAQERYSLDRRVACVAMPGLTGWQRRRYRYPYTVLEIKSHASLPDGALMKMFSLVPVSFSKYAYGCDALLGEGDKDAKYQ